MPTPLDELKCLVAKFAEGAPAQGQGTAVLPVELLYPGRGLLLHSAPMQC